MGGGGRATSRLSDVQPWRGGVQLGETGGLVWGRDPGPATLPPHPSTYLLLNVRQRLDGQISKGREGLVSKGRSVLDPDPYLEPHYLIFKPLSVSTWTSSPSSCYSL